MKSALIAFSIVAVFTGLLLLIPASEPSGHQVENSRYQVGAIRAVTFKIAAPCGKTEGDGIHAWQAVRRGDKAALSGMETRGNFHVVEKGVNASQLTTSNGMSAVSIDSGYQAGETCWVPSGVLE